MTSTVENRIERRPFASLGHADHGWLNARHHFSFADGMSYLQKTVSQGGFAVVNMSDDTKITDVLHVR